MADQARKARLPWKPVALPRYAPPDRQPIPPWVVGSALSTAVAVAAVIIGDRLDLIGLLIVGPCAAVFSGQGRQTALVAAWAVVLAAGIGAVNGIWGTFEQVAFVSAVVVVSAVATAAAYIIERVAPSSMRTPSEPASAASTRSDHN